VEVIAAIVGLVVVALIARDVAVRWLRESAQISKHVARIDELEVRVRDVERTQANGRAVHVRR
jgi:hypothetical protein